MISVENNSILKKISAVIVMITALLFFSFNVFADTPVQPLQVITYSDTSTSVRISGTAERLHYNIDSFQVVFMNPPNNYGTACTPVLVSFRFYNASDNPAYVGQPEFELTATTGTGSVNTIIYGYDQISTDLFVAESSYSTAEVGRIGIGASNDFAYYTGFVIPPRTSLYFSCIVYINASAYGQNNTGSQEDVNQVTLSKLNLYTNQISFSADYPYHNKPIDFSGIIQAISDLSDTVSTSTEMQDLIDAVTYSGSSPSYLLGNGNATYIEKRFSSDYTVFLHRFVSQPYLVYSDTVIDPSNDNVYQNASVRYDIKFIITEQVVNSNLSISPSSIITDILPNGYYANLVVDNMFTSSFESYNLNNNRLTLNRKNTNVISYRYVLNKGPHVSVINAHITLPYGTTLTFGTPSLDSFTSYYDRTDVYAPESEYFILRDLYLAYSQVNGLDDSSDISNNVSDVSDSNHIIEESYYSANASAIEATGLSNYRFSNEQNNGIGKVADDFMLLWNALGSWNGVYIFSLTMALATFIMRHGGLFTIKRETSDKGGDGE